MNTRLFYRCLQTIMVLLMFLSACRDTLFTPLDPSEAAVTDLNVDPVTGIPYAFVFSVPIVGFDTKSFGFGFGAENAHFCMERASDGSCTSYGHHLGRDTKPSNTNVGTEVVSPADGIVRITTDVQFGGYGSDSSVNPSYLGCLVVLEHEFSDRTHVLTLLGHLSCESGSTYSATAKIGNPSTGTMVRRGQYMGHVAHYWSGSGTSTDWHHLHWAMRAGPFAPSSYTRSGLADYVRGYAPASEFSTDTASHVLSHPVWRDPFAVLAAYDDPTLASAARVRSHIPGSLLLDPDGSYWTVSDPGTIREVPNDVLADDRYETSAAVRVTREELACTVPTTALTSSGGAFIYKRPYAMTVVMAYDRTRVRYDVVRAEALFSWGFGFGELITDPTRIQTAETSYASRGLRTLRPGTLVKADESAEVSMVQPNGTRRPILSGTVFEDLGYRWETIVSLPSSVLDAVAGSRDARVFGDADLLQCGTGSVNTSVDAGSTSGDAGTSTVDASVSVVEVCDGLDNNGNGLADEIFLCKMGSMGSGCITTCNTAGMQLCTAPTCSFTECRPYPENCDNTIDDDCNGLIDCADSACTSSASCTVDASVAPSISSGQLRFQYAGPQTSGAIQLNGWWQRKDGTSQGWGLITECTDTTWGDGALDCTITVGAGAGPVIFQVNLPDGRFWGDESCDPTGGCGHPIGALTVSGTHGIVSYVMSVNNTNGQPYFNGMIQTVD